MVNMNPCKGCPNKGCGAFHDKCKPYQAMLAERQKMRDERSKRQFIEDDVHLRIEHCKRVIAKRRK